MDRAAQHGDIGPSRLGLLCLL